MLLKHFLLGLERSLHQLLQTGHIPFEVVLATLEGGLDRQGEFFLLGQFLFALGHFFEQQRAGLHLLGGDAGVAVSKFFLQGLLFARLRLGIGARLGQADFELLHLRGQFLLAYARSLNDGILFARLGRGRFHLTHRFVPTGLNLFFATGGGKALRLRLRMQAIDFRLQQFSLTLCVQNGLFVLRGFLDKPAFPVRPLRCGEGEATLQLQTLLDQLIMLAARGGTLVFHLGGAGRLLFTGLIQLTLKIGQTGFHLCADSLNVAILIGQTRLKLRYAGRPVGFLLHVQLLALLFHAHRLGPDGSQLAFQLGDASRVQLTLFGGNLGLRHTLSPVFGQRGERLGQFGLHIAAGSQQVG